MIEVREPLTRESCASLFGFFRRLADDGDVAEIRKRVGVEECQRVADVGEALLAGAVDGPAIA